MRFLSDITVDQAVAHHLDHLTPEKVISHRPLKLSDPLQLYLSEHILAVSRLSSLVGARFVSPDAEVGAACREMLSGQGKITPLSAKIAERLFSVMGNNRSLSPGLLIVALVRNNENKKRFVALLKMESQPVFKEIRHESEDGGISIELGVDPVALPAPGRHLQKCALIKAEHTLAQPEILLIDRQARDAAVAGFFHERFLQAEYCRDSHSRTRKFVREFVKWANKAREEHRLSPQEMEKTLTSARDELRHTKISVPELVEKSISNRGEQHHCMEHLAKTKVDPEFESEAKASEKFRKMRVLKLDHGTLVRLPHKATLQAGFYHAEPDPEDQTVTVITLRTRKFQAA